MCVFRCLLKESSEGAIFRSRGRAFQRLGAMASKARSSLVTRCVRGTSRRCLSADLSERVVGVGRIISEMYVGAGPWIAL